MEGGREREERMDGLEQREIEGSVRAPKNEKLLFPRVLGQNSFFLERKH